MAARERDDGLRNHAHPQGAEDSDDEQQGHRRVCEKGGGGRLCLAGDAARAGFSWLINIDFPAPSRPITMSRAGRLRMPSARRRLVNQPMVGGPAGRRCGAGTRHVAAAWCGQPGKTRRCLRKNASKWYELGGVTAAAAGTLDGLPGCRGTAAPQNQCQRL